MVNHIGGVIVMTHVVKSAIRTGGVWKSGMPPPVLWPNTGGMTFLSCVVTNFFYVYELFPTGASMMIG
jgi:hypothetical protein